MNKLIVTVILAAFTAVCSFGAAAGSDDSDKNKETTAKPTPPQDTSKRDGGKKGDQPSSTSEIMREKMPKDLPPGVKHEYRDQEVMDKKPYKQ
ncbi:hypothetical protein [Nitrosovibrio sp. Nv4]|uniref:hypothetical protein n=1 Tax=Nitrosovibrio sp. Nv4 TaxID=1945880 RepID=UPI000BC3C1EA|nr:hypothetical protein [Nitrosovibrio sp. Nv4]SOD40443.1 hypothetical protein SAMN06298226_0711 [Nitrosovibrio sp. Nv4]